MDARKRWMAVARPLAGMWSIEISPVGAVETLLARLTREAAGAPVAFGVDFPLGLPRGYAALQTTGVADFPAFLRAALSACHDFFAVADTLDQVTVNRPFYPRRGLSGMTRSSLAHALGLPDAASLSRACDRATPDRPAGAPLFWTLGANQSGKAAIAAWRDLVIPALAERPAPLLWPFDGPLLTLLQPGRVALAETYPADALRQLGLRPIGSKRRQADRAALVPGLRQVLSKLGCSPAPALARLLDNGFGPDPAGEDRMDCLLGVLCVMQVVMGRQPDAAPPDPWIQRWEGWVLGQRWQPHAGAFTKS